MDSHTKWTISIGVALAGLIVAIAVLFSGRIDDVAKQVAEAKVDITNVETRLTAKLDAIDRRISEAQNTANTAFLIAAQGNRDATRVVLEGADVPESEIVQLLDYLDDTPKRVGRVAEDALEDVGEVLEDIVDFLNPFD